MAEAQLSEAYSASGHRRDVHLLAARVHRTAQATHEMAARIQERYTSQQASAAGQGPASAGPLGP